jgi:autotransporter-associated beta strand protein
MASSSGPERLEQRQLNLQTRAWECEKMKRQSKNAKRCLAVIASAIAMKAGLSFGQTATYVWNGNAGDGIWETGVSQNNWDGGSYAPGNGGGNNFVFVDFSYNQAVNTVTLTGGHNPNVDNLALNANNFATPFKIVIDGSNTGTHLDLEVLSTEDSIDVTGNNYEIDSVNDGQIDLYGSGGIWSVGTSDTFSVNAPIVDTGAFNRGFQKRGGGTLVLNAESTFDGSFDAGQGPTEITSLAVMGQPSAVGTGTGAGSAPVLISNCTSETYRSGSLIYNGASTTTDRPIQVAKDVRTSPTNITADAGTFTVLANTVTLTGGMATFPVGSAANPGVYTNYTVGGAGNIVLNTTGISGDLTLIKSGAGTVQLNAASSYDGNTTIQGGVLQINASNAGQGGAGTYEVQSGGTLSGTGTVTEPITVDSGGTLRPGNGGGVFNAAGVSLAGNFLVDVLANGTSGELVSTNSVSIGSAAQISVLDNGSLPIGTELSVIDTPSALTGTFAGLANGSQFSTSSNTYEINYTSSDVTFTVVPEPSALWLGPFTAVSALVCRRRRRPC